MSEQRSGILRIVLSVVLLAVAAVAIAFWIIGPLLSDDSAEPGTLVPPGRIDESGEAVVAPDEVQPPDEADEAPVETEEAPEDELPSRFVPDEDDGTASRSGQQTDEPGPVDPQEFAQARQQALDEAFGEEGPTPCENLCDCAQGQDCQSPPGICMPSRNGIFCCDNPGCEEGMPCRDVDGNMGVCGE